MKSDVDDVSMVSQPALSVTVGVISTNGRQHCGEGRVRRCTIETATLVARLRKFASTARQPTERRAEVRRVPLSCRHRLPVIHHQVGNLAPSRLSVSRILLLLLLSASSGA